MEREWIEAPLAEVIDFQEGPGILAVDFRDTGVPLVRLAGLDRGGSILTGCNYLDPDVVTKRWSHFTLSEGDTLLSTSGTLGRIATVSADAVGAIPYTGIIRMRPRDNRLLEQFIPYLLEGPIFQTQAELVGVGGVIKHFGPFHLRQMTVRLPPPDEQRGIAEALSDVDGLLGELDALIAKKRAIKQAAMQQLLTGKTRLPEFSGEWETKRLGDLAHIKTGTRNNEDKAEDGQFPFYVRSENVERINTYSHDCEAILVPGEGHIGSIFHYMSGRFDVHQRVYAITQFTQDMSGRFVHAYMRLHFGAWAMQNTVKATVDSLRLPTFQFFEMRVPPTKNEQTAIATVLSDMDAEIAALEARWDKTSAIKQGMMHDLLTGRVRLVQPAPVEESA
jgi:type I restriction enzyme, S subunit